MQCVPVKLRHALDQHWEYGVYLGRSLIYDQKCIGKLDGTLVTRFR